jgi:hypothetical protein
MTMPEVLDSIWICGFCVREGTMIAFGSRKRPARVIAVERNGQGRRLRVATLDQPDQPDEVFTIEESRLDLVHRPPRLQGSNVTM